MDNSGCFTDISIFLNGLLRIFIGPWVPNFCALVCIFFTDSYIDFFKTRKKSIYPQVNHQLDQNFLSGVWGEEHLQCVWKCHIWSITAETVLALVMLVLTVRLVLISKRSIQYKFSYSNNQFNLRAHYHKNQPQILTFSTPPLWKGYSLIRLSMSSLFDLFI